MNVDLEVKANFLQIFQSAITAIFCHLIRHLNPISSCNGNYNDLLCGACQQNLKTNHRKDFPSNIIIVLVEFLFKKVFKRNFLYKVLLLKTYTELCGGGAGAGRWWKELQIMILQFQVCRETSPASDQGAHYQASSGAKFLQKNKDKFCSSHFPWVQVKQNNAKTSISTSPLP